MTRENIQREILNLKGTNFLLELPTGTGKSKLAIDKVRQLNISVNESLLIVVPRNVLKDNWRQEILKWWPNNKLNIIYTTYVSLPKHAGNWDFVIFDEAHHLSDRCRESLCDFNIKHSILLSATIPKALKDALRGIFKPLTPYKYSLRKAIEEDILPDPKVYLLPLQLNNTRPTEVIYKNKKAKGKLIECNWAQRWKYMKVKNIPIKINCTQLQYYSDLCSQINYWKRRSYTEIGKNKWLRLCADRLKWLSDIKLPYIYPLLEKFKNQRTLTFCNNIEQTVSLGKYCINSKNKNSFKHISDFNNHKINHITACNMINEGINLVDCQIGIYANLNSSDTIIKQRIGRLLRHKHPIIIIPYFKKTREEELVAKMLENYNSDLVIKISNINDL